MASWQKDWVALEIGSLAGVLWVLDEAADIHSCRVYNDLKSYSTFLSLFLYCLFTIAEL
jgi:hypothetical protein